MRLARLTLPLAALSAALAGCQGLVDQLDADMVAMAALVRTPDMTVPAPTQSEPLATRIEPGSTILTVFFGSLDKKKLIVQAGKQLADEGAFKPAPGAIMTLDYPGCATCPIGLSDDGEGKYSIDKDTAGALEYREATYTLTIKYSGRTHKLAVDAPAPLVIDEFRPENTDFKTVWSHAAGSKFTVTRYEAVPPNKRPVAFLTAKALGEVGGSPYTTIPTEPLALLNLLFDDSPLRERAFDVPGSVFSAESDYLVTLAAAERGGAVDDDATLSPLFGVSSFVAGVADGGVVSTKVRPSP
jgi:hypothetical protein